MPVSQLMLSATDLLIDVTLKATALLLLAWLAAALLSRSSAAIRHRVWSLTMIGLLLLPVLSGWLPTWRLPVLPTIENRSSVELSVAASMVLDEPSSPALINDDADLPTEASEQIAETAAASASQDEPIPQASSLITTDSAPWPWLATWGLGIWCVGLLFGGVSLVCGLWSVRRQAQRSIPINDHGWLETLAQLQARLHLKRTVQLRESPQPIIPMTFGVVHPVILLPPQARDWSEDMRRAVLLHELAHVQRADVLFQLLGRAACAQYWFHPLVWLALKNLRREREQACDDAVLHTGEPVTSYAEQLLEVARLYCRPHRMTLAVEMARISQLEQRLRSMFDAARSHAPMGRRTAFGVLLISLSVCCAIAVIKPVEHSVLAIAQEPPKPKTLADQPWGEVSHGLQCRLLAASSETFDEDPGSAVQTERFSDADDVTFAVELRNVSGKRLTLLGVRRTNWGAGEPEELATSFYAPFLFEFEVRDEQGNPIDRPTRAFAGSQSIILGGASLHTIEPDKSLVVLLRPAQFYPVHDYQLPKGRYRATVRYHGPDEKTIKDLQERRRDFARANAWPHEVRSNEVAFTVDGPPATRPTPLAWGPVNDGLQAAIEFRRPKGGNPVNDPPGTFPVGRSVETIYHVKNVSDRTIQFVTDLARQEDVMTIKNDAGEMIDIKRENRGFSHIFRWTLKPGQVAELPIYGREFQQVKQPGVYLATCRLDFNQLRNFASQGWGEIFQPDDWRKELVTGETPITFRPRTPEDEAGPSVPEPIMQKGYSAVVMLETTKKRDTPLRSDALGRGLGLVIDARGYAVTAGHLVNDVDSLRVTAHNNARFSTAQLVATDPDRHLSIIQFERSLPVAQFNISGNLKVGDTIYALTQDSRLCSRGTITALNRDVKINETETFKNLIEFDAPLSPGDSGGPLLNADGEIIGINIAIRAGKKRLGFAIPIDELRTVVARLMAQIEKQ